MSVTTFGIRTVFAAAAIAMASMVVPAQAFEPSKPIDFVIMASKGGGADRMARLIQSIVEKEHLAPHPLMPANKPGGTGAEALVHMNNARDPDHTIMVTLNSFFTTPLRQPGLRLDIMEFAPIGRMAEDTFLLWVHKDADITSFEQFLAEAKTHGRRWVMGGTGKNSEDNIITDHLNNAYGLGIKYISYRGGGAVAKELAGRRITSSVNNPSEALEFHRSGKVVPLVAFSDARLAAFPDIPTLKELGGDFSYFMHRAIVGAPGMSDAARAYYSALFEKVYKSEIWQQYMSSKSLVGSYLAGNALKDYWRIVRDRHTKILKASGVIR